MINRRAGNAQIAAATKAIVVAAVVVVAVFELFG